MMRARFGWLLTLGLLGLFATAPQAFAATFTVTSLADSGGGTLRDTIAGASSGDTITFGVTGLITLTSGPIIVNPDLTISGPGASSLAISGGGNSQVFEINGSVTISGLTLEDGKDFQGGAIFNGGTLSLNNCVLTTNTTPLFGGAVWNNFRATLTVNGSTFSGNSATVFGGAIFNEGTLSVSNSTFSGNSADQQGGAIWSDVPLSVSASTFSGNSSTFDGGAIWASDMLTVINSTFSGNISGFLGGAIANEFAMNLSDSTFSGNSAAVGAGGILNDFATVAAKGNLLAGNSPDNCEDDSGGLVSQGYNLSSDASCATSFTMTGDINSSTAARLDPAGLADNGGPTQTIALLSNSAAVDAIPVADCTDVSGNTVTADQRGVSRPQGAGCDIGAFEFEKASAVPFSAFDLRLSIDSTAPGFSLRGTFTLGAASDGINPLTEPVTITLGTYSVTIPPSSFKLFKNGTFMFQGTIGGVNLVVQIVPLGGASYQIKANGSPVNLSGLTNPVTVTLVIGNDSGTTSVMANL